MTVRLLLVFTIQGIVAIENGKKLYNGYQVWEVDGNFDGEHVTKFDNRDVWRDNNTFNFLLNGNETESWGEYLKSQNISYRVLLSDVQARIDELLTSQLRRDLTNSLSWAKQPTLPEISKFLKKIADANPAHCTLSSIGKTLQKKDIQLLKLSNGNKKNKAILIDAGFHGREWTAVLSALFFIESIASNFSQQHDTVKNLDWYILPVMNPDGYEYTMSTDRLWRKNRRRFSGPCSGVDLNRNFEWCQRGASADICSQLYCGPEPFSEVETRAFRDLVLGKRFMVYISLHSSGTKVLYPWSFSGDPTPDFKSHVAVTREMVKAMRSVAHAHYTNGNIQKMGLDRGAGLSIDWMYFDQEIANSYLIETRGLVGLDLLEWHEVTKAVKEVRAGLLKLAELCHY